LENETPIILLPAGNATPTPESVEQSPAAEVDNWQVWWELFFDQKN
jgi:hypothetical protein